MMKKPLVVTMALLLVTLMATFAIAEDRLSMSGGFRTVGFMIHDRDYDNDVDDDAAWISQRLRIYSTIKVMDGVAIRLRTDFQETTWGLNTKLFGRPDDGNDPDSALQIDRAFLQINKPKFDFTIGHFYQFWGTGSVWQPQELGMTLTTKTPIKLTFSYFKLSENGSTIDDIGEDEDLYGILAEYRKLGAYFAMINDDSAGDSEPWAVGLFGSHSFNKLSVTSSLDILGGDMGAVDYMGAQFWLGLEYPFTKSFTAGCNFYYAPGTDDADEIQINSIWPKFDDFAPYEKGLLALYDQIDTIGTGNQPFEIAADSGSVSFDVFGIYKATPDITLAGQFGYFTPEEDSNTALDSLFSVNGSVQWAWAKKAILIFSGWYTTPDFDGAVADDATIGGATMLRVNF